MVTKHDLVCTKEQAVKLQGMGPSIFAWTEQKDEYGKINILDDNYGDGYPAYTAPEMLEMLPKMGKIKRFFFILRTGLNPVKVADYLISKL